MSNEKATIINNIHSKWSSLNKYRIYLCLGLCKLCLGLLVQNTYRNINYFVENITHYTKNLKYTYI